MDRNVSINTDLNGRKVVIINDIRFKGKRKIDWTDVENYLKKFIGEIYEIEDSQDKIYIGKDLPDEFSGSEDTSRLKGALAKAKANIFVFRHGKMQIKQLWTPVLAGLST